MEDHEQIEFLRRELELSSMRSKIISKLNWYARLAIFIGVVRISVTAENFHESSYCRYVRRTRFVKSHPGFWLIIILAFLVLLVASIVDTIKETNRGWDSSETIGYSDTE